MSLELVNGHLDRVEGADLDEMIHARRLILRLTKDLDARPDIRFELMQAVGISYVLCPCGAAMPDEARAHSTSVKALIDGWRQELGEHQCEKGAKPSAVLRCPGCVAAGSALAQTS